MRPPAALLRPLSDEDAAVASTWRYEGPWSVYDGSDDDPISAAKGYQAIEDADGRFIGFVCAGFDARVPGLTEEDGVLDVGVGLEPALVGKGRGASILGPLLEGLVAESGASSLRAVVQSWNARSLQLCTRLGFREAGKLVVEEPGGSVDYVVVVRALGTPEGTV